MASLPQQQYSANFCSKSKKSRNSCTDERWGRGHRVIVGDKRVVQVDFRMYFKKMKEKFLE